MNPSITVELISPLRAAELLQNILPKQRTRRVASIARLAKEMRMGEFRLSPDAIVLLKGQLANGQHRLEAVVDSGITCPFLVLKTDDDEIYKIMDCGLKRSLNDVAGLPHTSPISTVAAVALHYVNGTLTCRAGATGLGKKISRIHMLEYMEANSEDIQRALEFIEPLYQKSHLMSRTLGASFIFCAGLKGLHEKAKEFMTRVFEGTSPNTSAHDLRERLIKNSMTKSTHTKLKTGYVFALTIKAFRSYCNGTRPGVLKVGEDEDFPQI